MLSVRALHVVRSAARASPRLLHTSRPSLAVTELTMPALSPTMTEGTVTEWKFAVGDKFVAGDILLQIETDKASIDVEAQDDGVMGMILVPNNTSGVPCGNPIALLAEEDDDLSTLVAPTTPAPSTISDASPPPAATSPPPPAATSPPPPAPKAAAPATTPTPASAPAPPTSHAHPTHSQPLLPSVSRLLMLNHISDASVITATGHKGMLSKGDVLAYLGKISSPRGSEKEIKVEKKAEKVADKPLVELDGPGMRRLVAAGLGGVVRPTRVAAPTFEDILNEYLPVEKRAKKALGKASAPVGGKSSFDAFLDM